MIAARVLASGQLRGAEVISENGTSFLFVTGTCRYVVRSPDLHPWEGAHEGVLDSAQQDDLARRLHVDSWDRLNGSHVGERIADGGVLSYESLTAAVTCAGCRNAGPPELVDIDRNYAAILGELWIRGTAVRTADLWARALRTDAVASACTSAQQWTWNPPISQFAVTQGASGFPPYQLGDGTRLDDQATVAALRRLRTDFLMSDSSACPGTAGIRDPAGLLYQLSFRDGLPGEDTRGLVRVGAPIQ